MGWVLEMTSSPAFNFTFSFSLFVFIPIVGVIIVLKVIKEGFRR